MEIERKYLVAQLPPNLESFPHVDMEQGYLNTSPTLRIRKAGDIYYLTVKQHISNTGAIVNREEEFEMPASSYQHLLPKCDGIIISKTRYRIPLQDGLTAELDIFKGSHAGLCIVEVEFPSIEAANAFVAPSWFGQDVSQQPQYRNAYLSSHLCV